MGVVLFFVRLAAKTVGLLVLVAGIGVAVVYGVALANYHNIAQGFTPPDVAAMSRVSAGAKVFDRNGNLLYEYVDDNDGLRQPVKLEDVSPAFLAATIATEDASFFENPGVNLRGLARAAWQNFSPLATESGILQGTGGSSITQQVIKNYYVAFDRRSERSLDRKAMEIVYAAELTKRFEKRDILEWYINGISYGGLYVGVEAASQGYFGKPARDLTLAEAALLAGLPQSPADYDPVAFPDAAKWRRDEVLAILARRPSVQIGPETIYIPSQDEIAAALEAPLEVRVPVYPVLAPHFVLTYVAPQVEQLLGKDALARGGLFVHTTLDLELQRSSEAIVERSIADYEASSNARNGAALVIEPRTGEILAMVGSRDYFRDDIDGNVNNLLAGNSPGSTFKPFVYLTTFLKLGWGPGSTIEDTRVDYREVDGTIFSPVNPDKQYHGTVTVRSSLGNSLNVTAFKAAQAVGVQNVLLIAKEMGFTGMNGTYGPALAIGGVDLKPIDLTYAYSVLANGGVMVGQDTFAPERPDERTISPIAITRIEDQQGNVLFDVEPHRVRRTVVPPEYVYLVTDILTDPNAHCMTFGCGGLSVPGYKVAAKTGTSSPYAPNGPNDGKIGETWAFGYTADLAVGIWAGNSDNSPVVNIFSTTIAHRAMRDIMLRAYNGRPQTPFTRPPGVIQRSFCRPAPEPDQNRQPDAPPRPVATPTPAPQPVRPGRPGQQQPALAEPEPQQVCSSDIGVARPAF